MSQRQFLVTFSLKHAVGAGRVRGYNMSHSAVGDALIFTADWLIYHPSLSRLVAII